MTIYVFGNEDIDIDSLPVKLLPELSKQCPEVTFIHADPTENWHKGEKDIVIIDTVCGIKSVTQFDSLDSFQKQTHRTSLHDYDVYTDIALMKKIGRIESVQIIGVPQEGKHQLVLNAVVPFIKQLTYSSK